MQFEPIGFLESCYKERFGTPRQSSLVPSSWAILRLRPELNLAGALSGLEGFSHLWLIFVFHQNTNKGVKTMVHPPRLEGQKMGVFATRSPHRFNPIGLSAVKLEKIEKGTLHLSGIDFVDGTPVLDIKPYLPTSDFLPQATEGWTQQKPVRTLQVEFTEAALEQIKDREKSSADRASGRLEQLIRETLELDPRPHFYKGTAEAPNPYMERYGFCLEDFNVVYRVNGTVALVEEIQLV
jgi:tRNA-Thr(GGU) m(6)t(6)A37 methyltransferase TsaA